MIRKSLAWRLLAIAALWIAGTLCTTGWILDALFGRHVDRTYIVELDRDLASLAGALEWRADGTLELTRQPAEPRFDLPYSGAYWQASAGNQTLRSRSLWDVDIPTQVERPVGHGDADIRIGPREQSLLVKSRKLQLAGTDTPIDVTVALDRTELRHAKRSFRHLLWLSLGVLGVGILGAVWAQIRFGLAPLSRLRAAVAGLHAGSSSELVGTFPAEVQPLVDEINALLERNRQAVERSRRQAADLAHAVKTPLAILSNSAAALPEPASHGVQQQLDAMRQQVDRHLARARAAGAGGAARGTAVPVRPAVASLARALERLHAERPVSVRIDGEAAFSGDRQDLVEMLGNLLDNAWQWARSEIRVTLDGDAGRMHIRIEDDGPGMPADAMRHAVQPFARLDEAAEGSGLGLAIVRDICTLYGGELALGKSSLGGLAATLHLPGP
ncbi:MULTISPECIES: HAMP domain-containing sensor histidine kinase [unclassified Cupriavidus]|uniref:sensor histidine kinase n=1 Tax=unclassified Cupriavidus TaxID=2640874 RepID=UPI0010F45ED8|nr:HAMP domain-containing sensor histidine kinase [Cupriavidus sp. 2SB]MWL89869.1 GHKL domain-containing protein [Cupriavidus sp. SW-Y-13]